MSGVVAILGADAARGALASFDGFDEVVILEPSVDALEELLRDLADPRLDYLLGALPVLPLPDASVDRVIGADGEHPEIARVLR